MSYPNFHPACCAKIISFAKRAYFLAFKFLRTAHMIVEKHDAYTEEELRQFVNTALDELLNHRKACDDCNER